MMCLNPTHSATYLSVAQDCILCSFFAGWKWLGPQGRHPGPDAVGA